LSEALGLKVDLVIRDAVKRGLATQILSEAVMLSALWTVACATIFRTFLIMPASLRLSWQA
jgi:hypothetical protein